MNLPGPVVDQNKIVSRAIHFRETQHDDDCSGGHAHCHVEPCLPLNFRACHPERSEAESKDPAELQYGMLGDSSTSLGMTQGHCEMPLWRLLIPLWRD